MPYLPKFSVTLTISSNLMKIQDSATLISQLPLPAHILRDLKHDSMVETVIYSTKIEGNFLNEDRKRAVMFKQSSRRDEQEVYNLCKALEFLDDCETRRLQVTEELIKKLHAIIKVISSGRRPTLSLYRAEQNVVKGSGKIVYLPPEPQDVPMLMEDMVAWLGAPETLIMPAPIKAGIFMYQFVTIHPYMDGNGRTARALATYILRLAGLGLNGLFVLEKFYDRNLRGYYDSLQMGLHHNYYFGRNEADITPWLEFFISGLAEVFQDAATIVRTKSAEFTRVEPELLRTLDIEQRMVFAQLAFRHDCLTPSDLQKLTGYADRTVRDKIRQWIGQGFIVPSDPNAQRVRAVKMAPKFQELAKEVGQDPEAFKYLLS
jgi:Fic family protein